MCDEAPIPPDSPSEGNAIYLTGLGATFALVLLCWIGNVLSPGSIPSEPIWAFAAVVLGHKVSNDWRAKI